jgi:hypothetical protein
MSWHCVGPAAVSGSSPTIIRASWGSAWRRIALSAAVGAPVPPRDSTIWPSAIRASSSSSTISWSLTVKTNAPRAFASAISFAAVALSSGVSPCEGGATRLSKIRGELTIAACSGCATGTLITSIRNQAVFGSTFGIAALQPASSPGERTAEDPEMYT